MDELDRARSRWRHPMYAAIQDTVRERTKRKGYPVTGSLRQLMDHEYGGYKVPMTHGLREGYAMLRLVSYKNQPAGHKLEFARMPVIILHGADDPLVPAQDIADLVAGIANPKVAAIILPSGGHVGFAGYAPNYCFSLIRNFFDPVRGAASSFDPASVGSEPGRSSYRHAGGVGAREN
jgi:alpha-beta hydrolase superfamily lysophospholipase